jgi:hypothetical protein
MAIFLRSQEVASRLTVFVARLASEQRYRVELSDLPPHRGAFLP